MQLFSQEALIGLDHSNGEISFVSHAHSDHIAGLLRKERIIASEETIALANLKGKNENIKGIKLLEAGHILGSRQLLVETDGKKIVYTGDIRTRNSVLFRGAEIPECDKLIIESTFYHPHFRFPDYYEVCLQIEKWINKNSGCNLLIGGYALGKAQELIKIVNNLGIFPVVDKNIEHFNQIYKKFGIRLKCAVVGTEEAEEAMKKPFVGIIEMKKAKRYFARRLQEAFERKTLVAVATGWALQYKFDADIGFALSDHADFYDLQAFIKNTNAKEIEFFGNAKPKVFM